MEGPELEYRAKLTELALAHATLRKTLAGFGRFQGDARATPNGHVNKRVLSDLRERLGLAPAADLSSVDAAALRQAASDLLVQDNARRDQAAPRPGT